MQLKKNMHIKYNLGRKEGTTKLKVGLMGGLLAALLLVHVGTLLAGAYSIMYNLIPRLFSSFQ